MSLADLIKKGSLRGFATATPATVATDRPVIPPSVATVATVAVASAQNPASKLSDPMRAALRDAKPELLALLAATTTPAQERPYRLTQAQGDAAHAEPWDDATIARFQARAVGIARRGFGAQDAEDLAEQLHLRDVHADYRHLCLECKHLAGAVSAGWRCGNHKAAGLNAAQVAADLVVMQQYCQGFADEGGGYA